MRGALLLMVTLGIYRFWLMTDVRRFLWSNTEIAGEALEYTGTPLELLIGFLVAVAILIPVYTGFFLAALDLGTIGRLSGVARLRCTRPARPIRHLSRAPLSADPHHLPWLALSPERQSAWRYAFCAVFWWTLTALTLGLAYPFQLARLERYKMRNTFYGDLAGRFEGSRPPPAAARTADVVSGDCTACGRRRCFRRGDRLERAQRCARARPPTT